MLQLQKRLDDAMCAKEEEWCHDLKEPVTEITKQRVHLIPPKWRLILKSDSRVTTIYHGIQIVTKAEKDARRKKAEEGQKDSKEGIGQTVDDIWISTKIEAQLIATKGVTSVNYRWRSVRNQVSIIGRANSVAERTTVLDVIKATKGVDSVKNYIEIKQVHP